MNLRSVEEYEQDIVPYFSKAEEDIWVNSNTVILKDAWNEALARYESRFNTSVEELLKKVRHFDEANQRYSLSPQGNVQYFVKPKRSGRRQFISLYDEWLHYHETVDLDRLNDPEYMQLLKETTLEQIPEGAGDRRGCGHQPNWDYSDDVQSYDWRSFNPIYFTRRLEHSSLGVIGDV